MTVASLPRISDSDCLPRGAGLCGRYIVTGVMRDDGGSTLYAGRTTTQAGEPVMIKEVVPEGFVAPENRSNAQSRFLREVQVLQELKHPALPSVLDAFAENGRQYLVMSFCPGDTLEAMLARRGRPFSEEDVVGWSLEILSALSLMHRHAPPVIYRNLKPGNIVIDPTGMVRLLDFGLARFFTPGKRLDTAPIGPAGYAPPEQTSGTTDARSDLYALGMTMYHLLTGQHPAHYAPGGLPPASVQPDVSADIAGVITRAVELDPGRRWGSAAEMEMVLRRHVVTLHSTARARAAAGPSPDLSTAPISSGARLVIYGLRATGSGDEMMYHLMRLTWMTRRQLERALGNLPAVVPLIEPYKASLRVLKALGVDARAIWPLRGMHLVDAAVAAQLDRHGRANVDDPGACEDGVCLCRHCHFGWIVDEGEAAPATCPSCGRSTWNKLTLLRCTWCEHESEESAAPICPCCGLPPAGPARAAPAYL